MDQIQILLLENINRSAELILRSHGYSVECIKTSLSEDELVEKIRNFHIIGIRSKTQLTKKVLENAKNLLAIGCFCIGTNQVDLEAARQLGIAVFNSPFSNSRSVAELVIAEVIMLARQLGDRNIELHSGIWNKNSKGCWEIRGKVLGIVGYGHIGCQLSVLAEAMGMQVIFYDIIHIMELGMARRVTSLRELLQQADFVSLHVPESSDTMGMIGSEQFNWMKPGSYLVNNSRGSVVDIPALIQAVKRGTLAGAALDVYPLEPGENNANFNGETLGDWATELKSLPNVILTPHIGGSTEEAQFAIGEEVSRALVNYLVEGSTIGSVNFPALQLRSRTNLPVTTNSLGATVPLTPPTEFEKVAPAKYVRIVFIHKNVPGVLSSFNRILAEYNVEQQISDYQADTAYALSDVILIVKDNVDESTLIPDLHQRIEQIPSCIRCRIIPE